MNKHDSYVSEMWAWQSRQLDLYRSKSYLELMSLPKATQLSAPEKFRKYRFMLLREEGENGGVKISICHYQRFLLIFNASCGVSFEMMSNGIIVDDTEESPED
ncbi:MAG TPA: hypothetical protein PK633_07870 [Agitococcus sp.]|nr:hypothetical protein [Agitococcus sp.]HNH43994.1 hypothetical protein [Agitococcus sp.]